MLMRRTKSARKTICVKQTPSKPGLEVLEDRTLLDGAPYDSASILVRFRSDAQAVRLLEDTALSEPITLVPGLREVRLGAGVTVDRALAAYRASPLVQYAEPNYRVEATRIPNDPRYPELWGMAKISAPQAWDVTTGSSQTVVAVIDTGVDYNHPDLVANVWVNTREVPGNGRDDDGNGFVDDVRGWNFVSNNNNAFDDNGHGTHVGGTIGAVGNNGVGVVGVNWQVKIMPVKFLDRGGSGYIDDAVRALNYAVANGATISNNSWRWIGNYFSQSMYDSISAARQRGHVFVAAAGNENCNNDTQMHCQANPASYNLDNIIAVAATDQNDNRASFSSYGRTTVDLGAPGVSILSTLPNNQYGSYSGTSMAAPHVAGVVALVRGLQPGWTYTQVINRVFSTVDPVPSMQGITVTGGRLNAARAVQGLGGDPLLVTNCTDNGPGSLRAALTFANNNPGRDTVRFNTACTINVVSPLPLIFDPVVIDGTSAPGYTVGRPVVELNGAGAGTGTSGLVITAGNSVVKGLVLNRFAEHGLILQDRGGNAVQSNYFGLRPDGVTAAGNGLNNIFVLNSPNNQIGGSGNAARNVISASVQANGVWIEVPGATGNRVEGNYIGTDWTGRLPRGNFHNGVGLRNTSGNVIGGLAVGARNIIADNRLHGVRLETGVTSTLVQGNYIGTNVDGTAALGNYGTGVLIEAPSNTVGGPESGARNLISGNSWAGVLVYSSTATRNRIEGNYIGTDASGAAGLGNLYGGIDVRSSDNTIVRNVVSGNTRDGIQLYGTDAARNLIRGNFVGINAAGRGPLPNGLHGVNIELAPNNTIGGTTEADRNIISGNRADGVFVTGASARGNRIEGNYVGTSFDGSASVPNVRGIEVRAPNNSIARNVVSGNIHYAVYLLGASASVNSVEGNFLGTNAAGTAALPNGWDGVAIENAPNNTVGGTTAAARNVISGNERYGVLIQGSGATDNCVRGNYIGTNASGSAAVANGFDGVLVEAGGRDTRILSNVISGNGREGVSLSGNAGPSTLEGNIIGLAADGTTPLGNLGVGVWVSSANNVIGGFTAAARNVISANRQQGVLVQGTGATDNRLHGNTIAYNGASGVVVVSGTGNSIRRNSIHSNGGLGIDLAGDGVTPIDYLDADTGANELQNYPFLVVAVTAPEWGVTVVIGVLHSRPNTTFEADLFASAEVDPSGFGEGERYLGPAEVTTDDAGNGVLVAVLFATTAPGEFITATVTDALGNTSEFSPPVQVEGLGGFSGGDLPTGLRLGASPAYGLPNAVVPQRQRAEAAAWSLPDFGFDVLSPGQELSAVSPSRLRTQRDWQNGSPLVDHATLDQLALEWLGDE